MVSLTTSIHWRCLHQEQGMTWRQIQRHKKDYKKYSKATISRHMVKDISDNIIDNRVFNCGRPPVLGDRDKRNLLRHAEILRKEYGGFNIRRVKVAAGVSQGVCDETIRKVFRDAGFKYCHSRKKGVLQRKDVKARLEFARKVKRLVADSLWTEGIAFYLDGVGFAHKYNPFDQARTPTTMAWRKQDDGLSFERTARGSHEGTGGRVAHFICAIAHGRGMILAEQYQGRLNGQAFAAFIREQFPNLFERSANPTGRMFLQDGCPIQNSRKAKDAIDEVNARLFKIPVRSPDLNPIENIFHNVKRELRDEALRTHLTFENFEDFSIRCQRTLLNVSQGLVDRTIESMPKRIDMIIKSKGQRIKY